jgi:methanol---5-hydroxybenzimidazolylcobamide Co-methyltransferase
VYMEQLQYDVRLFNQAVKEGKESVRTLQRLLVNSDIFHDPQAFVLSPEVVIAVAGEIVKGTNHINATKRGCLKGIDLIEEAVATGKLMDDAKERSWIPMLKEAIASIPDDENAFVEEMLPTIEEGKVLLEEYGL